MEQIEHPTLVQCAVRCWTPNMRMPRVTYFPSRDDLPVENVSFSWIGLLPLAVFDRSPRLEILIRWWVRWLVILKLSNQSARCHFWSGSDIRKKSRGWEQSSLSGNVLYSLERSMRNGTIRDFPASDYLLSDNLRTDQIVINRLLSSLWPGMLALPLSIE